MPVEGQLKVLRKRDEIIRAEFAPNGFRIRVLARRFSQQGCGGSQPMVRRPQLHRSRRGPGITAPMHRPLKVGRKGNNVVPARPSPRFETFRHASPAITLVARENPYVPVRELQSANRPCYTSPHDDKHISQLPEPPPCTACLRNQWVLWSIIPTHHQHWSAPVQEPKLPQLEHQSTIVATASSR